MATVLVVEDEPNVRKLVAVNLSSRGYAVLEAMNVPQALDCLRTTLPDLMILDIKLPEMTGWDLLTQLAADPNLTVEFPVLVMTASIMEAQIDHDQYPNVVDVLIKPFSATQLMSAIERALRPSAPDRSTWSEF
ncbi:Transcriptional activator protein CzcR [Thermoflexales bacterium]|nr:Transcriptional activator protein CzcR [Thermoflexales bacterium]